jgi:hypothetical protein
MPAKKKSVEIPPFFKCVKCGEIFVKLFVFPDDPDPNLCDDCQHEKSMKRMRALGRQCHARQFKREQKILTKALLGKRP